MSYCRFENTLGDFDDCKDTLERVINSDEQLSDREVTCAADLFENAMEMVIMVADAMDYELDFDKDEFIKKAKEFIKLTNMANVLGEGE